MMKKFTFCAVDGSFRFRNPKVLIVFLFLIICNVGFAQTLISPTGDGGFETGTTFSANGWTQVGTANPTWYVGSGATPYAGTNEVHIGTSTSNFSASATSGVKHFYRDVTIPSGATNINLAFFMKMPQVDYSTGATFSYDYFKIFTTSTSNTPANNTVPTTGYTQVFGYEQPAISSWTNKSVNLPNSLAGTTIRLVFTYRNDGSTPNAYVALDNISLTYTPTTSPYVTAGTLSGFGNVCVNAVGGPNSFTISGGNLTPSSSVSIGALAGFSYSLSSSGTYTNTLSVPTDASGNIANQSVYVKFSPIAVQSYNGNIPITGAGLTSTVNVAATGTGVNTTPTVSANGTAGSITTGGAAITGSTISNLGCSSVTAYGIEYSTTSGFANGSGTAVSGSGFSGVAGGTFSTSLSGLSPSTTYYYKAYAINSGGTAYYSSQASFTTVCTTSGLPVSQGFNTSGASVFPACWTQQYVSGTKAITFETSAYVNSSTSTTAISPSEGSRFIYWNSYTNNGSTTRLVSLPINSTGVTNVEVDFNWFHSSAGGTGYQGEGVQVQYSTDGATWTNAGDFIKRYDATLSGWTPKSVFLPAAAGNQPVMYVGFNFVSNGGYNSAMDAVVIKQGTACTTPATQPGGLTFGSVSSTAVTGSFLAASSAPSGYIVMRSTNQYAPVLVNGTTYTGNNTLVNTNGDSATYAVVQNSSATSFTNGALTGNTKYYYYILSYNSGCAGAPVYLQTSPLTGSITTCATAPTNNSTNPVNSTDATILWTASAAGANAITYTVGVYTDSARTLHVTGSPFTTTSTSQQITGLNPSTTYYYRITANNGCDSSNLDGSFTTACVPANIPYTEDFNSTTGSSLPNCTSAINAGSGNIWVTDANPAAYGFSSRVLKYGYNSSTANTWFFTKGLNLTSGVSYRLTFKYNNNSSTYVEKLKIGIGTAATVAGMTTILSDYNNITGGSNVANVATIDFTPTANGVYFIGFQAYSAANQWNLYVDDINVDVAPPAITVTPANPNICSGGSVSLTASSTGTYTYSWSPSTGLSTATGATVTASPAVTTTYTVTGTNGSVSTAKTVTVTVNPVPATIAITDTVSPAAADACSTDYVKLDVTGLVPSIFLKDGFEVVSPNFVVVRDSNTSSSTAALNTTYYSEGSSSARLKGAGATDGAGGYISLDLKNSVDLTKYSAATLTFDHICAEEAVFDMGILYYSTNGGANWNAFPAANYQGSGTLSSTTNIAFDKSSYSSWDSQFTTSSSTPGTGPATSLWKSETIDLTPYIGSNNFKISFSCEYDDVLDYYGWLIDNVKINVTPRVTWTPIDGLYADAGLSTAYVAGTHSATVYAAPSGAKSYVATASLGGVDCDKAASKSVTRDKYDFKGTTTDWNMASNWFPALVPDADKCVNIPAGKTAVIGNDALAKSVKVASTGKLTIAAGKSLTVTDAINIDNNANNDNLVMESDASLIQVNNATNTGKIYVKRDVKMRKMDYTYWSSPVDAQPLRNTASSTGDTNPNNYNTGGFSEGTPNKRIYYYDEPTDYFKMATSVNFEIGKGYAIRGKDSYLPDGTLVSDTSLKFVGVPNNGNTISVGIQRTKNGTGDIVHGYNLIGNPYPSNLDFIAFYNFDQGGGVHNYDKIEGKAWFWTNTSPSTTQAGSGYAGSNYAVLSLAGGAPATGVDTNATTGSPTPTQYIKVGQGFIVHMRGPAPTGATPNTATLKFDNSMRSNSAGVFYNNNKSDLQVDRYWLKMVSPENVSNTILVAHMPKATNNYDEDYDADLLAVGDDSFYSKLNTQKLQIQARAVFDNQDVVALGTKYSMTGTYKIALVNQEGIFGKGQKIYLHDKLSNTYTDMSQGSYSFSATKGLDETRFEIVYKENSVLNNNDAIKSEFAVYRDGSDYVVKSSKILGKITMYDASGKVVSVIESKTKSTRINVSNVADGVYILNVENSGDVKTKKIIK